MSPWLALGALLAGAALLALVAASWTLRALREHTDLTSSAAGRVLVAAAVTASYTVGVLVALVIAWTADALSR